MTYRYAQGWKKAEALPPVAYLLPFLLPALLVLSGIVQSVFGMN